MKLFVSGLIKKTTKIAMKGDENMNKPQDDFLHTEAFQWCEKPKQKDMTKVEYLVFGLAIGMLLTVGLQMLSTWI